MTQRMVASILCSLLVVATAHAETAAERRERLRAEREQKQAAQKAEQERVRHPEAVPKDYDRSDQGFALRSVLGWLERADEGQPDVALQLIYVNLPPGQKDAGSFRVYVKALDRPQTLEETAENWKKTARYDREPQYGPVEQLKLDGIDAIALSAEGASGGVERVERAVIAIRGRMAYVLHTSSPKNVKAQVISTAKQMERSLKWQGEVQPFPEAVAEAPPVVETAQTQPPAEATAGRGAATDAASPGKARFAGSGIVLEYPEKWRRLETMPLPQVKFGVYPGKTGAEVVPGEDFAEHLLLVVEGRPGEKIEGLSARTLAEEMIKLAQRDYPGFELITSEPFKVGDEQGHLHTFRHEVVGMKLQATVIIAVRDGMRYTFRFSGDVAEYEQHAAEMKQIAATAKFVAYQPPARLPVTSGGGVSPEQAADVKAAMAEMAVLRDAELGLSFSYPASWKKLEGPAPIEIGKTLLHVGPGPDGGADQPRLVISVIEASELTEHPANVARGVAESLAETDYSGTPGSGQIGNKRVNIANADSKTLSSRVWTVEHRGRAFIIGFVTPKAAQEAWRPAVRAMEDAVVWIGEPPRGQRAIGLSMARPGIIISYPKEWKAFQAGEPSNGPLILTRYPDKLPGETAPGDFADVLVVSMEGKPGDDTAGLTARAMAEALLDTTRREQGELKVVESHARRFGSVEGWQVIEDHAVEGNPVRRLLACAVHDGRKYSISFTADTAQFEQHLPIVEAIVGSVRIAREEPPPGWARSSKSTPPARGEPEVVTPARPADPTRVDPALAAKVAEQSKELASFDDGQAGLKFRYPAKWTALPPDPSTQSMSLLNVTADTFGRGGQASVSINMLDKGPLTEDLKKLTTMMAMMATGGKQALQTGERSVGSKKGFAAVYQGQGQRSYAVAAEHRNTIYLFQFTAPDAVFNAWLPAVNAMLDSVHWLD